MNEGYILLHRKIIKEWEWYSNINDRLVFIHCLLRANWEDGWFEGIKIPRGSFVTSYKNLAKEVGISVQSLRTSLEHLKSTHNITHTTNRQFSIISINNYEKYQTDNISGNKRLTNDQQTTNNNIIKNKEIKEKDISKDISKKKDFIKPSIEEIENYCRERNNGINPNKFYDFYESKNWMIGKNKMKNWKACIRTWEQHDNTNNTNTSKLPDWFDKDFKERERTEDEERELQELIRGYQKT